MFLRFILRKLDLVDIVVSGLLAYYYTLSLSELLPCNWNNSQNVRLRQEKSHLFNLSENNHVSCFPTTTETAIWVKL